MSMSESKPGRCTPKQARAIDALLTEGGIDAAAKVAGVSRVTLWRWLQDETFCNQLKQAESERIGATIRRLTSLSDSAVSTLQAAMDNGKTSEQIRAADIVLARMLQLRELHDLEARVAALEAKTNGQSKPAN
jgi:hypothetical protein